MAFQTMNDLLVHELRDLLNAERQQLSALPKMAKAASHDDLVKVIENHHAETEEQVQRLEQCFTILDETPSGKKCRGMEGVIAEADEAIGESGTDEVRDAAIVGALQRMKHYEIAGYGTARSFARQVEQDRIANLLTLTVDEESEVDRKLTEIAHREVNLEAAH